MSIKSGKITTKTRVRELLGPEIPSQKQKEMSFLDEHLKCWLERSPFVVLSSSNKLGQIDASPKGGEPGFVKILDQNTLLIPDWPGNRRGDTLNNIVENPNVEMLFMVPPVKEVVRVSGVGFLTEADELTCLFDDGRNRPKIVIAITVTRAFFHCGKAMIRSGLWDPNSWIDKDEVPSYAEALKSHAKLKKSIKEISIELKANEGRLY